MKLFHPIYRSCWRAAWALPLVGCFCGPQAWGATSRAVVVTTPAGLTQTSEGTTTGHKIVIESVKSDDLAERSQSTSWLGVVTEECPDGLAAQLGLNPGEGLLVAYLAPDSPATKAGLQKHDVLTEFEGQLLVHPEQLRKLIQMRKEGDTVKLTLFRAGKKQTIEATVGKRPHSPWDGTNELHALRYELKDLPIEETVRQQMKTLRESLAQAGIDKESLSIELKHSIEEVRKAIQEALRQATNAAHTFGPAAREFQELAKRGFEVDKDATVVVKSKQDSVRSIVKTDDSGTYVVVANPKKRLTAHDKSGQMLFDGQIETPQEQEKVPKDIWAKVKPMIEQLGEDQAEPQKPGTQAEEQ